MIQIELQQARNLQLAAQGLLAPSPRKATGLALRRAIAQMQLLQIDTISVVARSPYLVLYSRLGHYPTAWLDEALADTHLFETWAHEACFAPGDDLMLHRSYNHQVREHWSLKRGRDFRAKHALQLEELLLHIKHNGPVKSVDFERPQAQAPGPGAGWWSWKPEKRWLESLFASGDLMVARRDKFQRVYDLAHRVRPDLPSLPAPTAEAAQLQFVQKAIAALGITQARWVHDYFRTKPRLKDSNFDALVDAGTLLRVQVEGWQAPGYVHADHAGLLKKAVKSQLQASHSALLSPFDPLVWDRERASEMFGFDYRIECYTPEAKRVYGYFVLPILHRGQLIGRLDAKAHRALGEFEIKALYLQTGMVLSDESVEEIAKTIADCASWHGTPRVLVAKTQPVALRNRIRKALAAYAKNRH